MVNLTIFLRYSDILNFNNLNPQEMSSLAPFLILIIGVVFIFGLTLTPPKKDD